MSTIETFGASAPLKELRRKFGFDSEHVVVSAKRQIADARANHAHT
jgi:transketolase